MWQAAAATLYGSALARDATFVPKSGGGPTLLRVVLDVRRDALDVTGELLVSDTVVLWCRSADVPSLDAGDVFHIDGKQWTVVGDPTLDEVAGEWRAEVRRE